MQLRAFTGYCETLVNEWEASAAQSIQRAFADGKAGGQVGDRQASLETAGSAQEGVAARQVWSHAAQSIDKTPGNCQLSGQDHTAPLETVERRGYAD